jgi:hypothetical protein
MAVDEVDAPAEPVLEVDLVAAGDGNPIRDDDHAVACSTRRRSADITTSPRSRSATSAEP